jgi:hypothetical protein
MKRKDTETIFYNVLWTAEKNVSDLGLLTAKPPNITILETGMLMVHGESCVEVHCTLAIFMRFQCHNLKNKYTSEPHKST